MRDGLFDSKISKLENGIELITVKKETELMAINIGIKVGSLYENTKEKGISHFVEHMMFKGTKNRNNEILNNNLESLGGDYNAYTDYMCTVYSVMALREELEESFILLSDMIINSIFPKDQLEKERGVILSEIKSSKDDIEDLSYRKINEYAFKNSSLKFDVLGNEETVRNFSRDILFSYYKKYYVPNNCVISVVSSLEHEKVREIVNIYFGQWESKELFKPKIVTENNINIKKESYKKDIEQSTLLYLYTFYGLSEEEELSLRVLNNRLGESANSILFRELREKRGLAYDIYTSIDCMENIKTLYIYTATEEENLLEAQQCINECIDNIKSKNIVFDNNTLELMKKIFKTSLISTLEDISELSFYVLNQIMEKRDVYELIREMKCLDNMKSEHIYNVAKKVLNNPTVHLLKKEF